MIINKLTLTDCAYTPLYHYYFGSMTSKLSLRIFNKFTSSERRLFMKYFIKYINQMNLYSDRAERRNCLHY